MSRRRTPRVAVFGIGLAAYWPQFDGLRERLEGYQRGIERRLEEMGAEVVSAGLVDTPQAARAAGDALAAARPRAPPRLHGDLRDVVAGAPRRAGGRRAGRRPQPPADAHARLRGDDDRRVARQLLGLLRARDRGRADPGGDPLQNGHGDAARRRSRPGTRCASGWTRRAPCTSLRTARIGFLGHTYPGMLDMYSDFTQVHAQTGAHVEVLEIDDLVARVESADADAIERKDDRDPGGLRPGGRRHRPDRRRDHAGGLRLVGARRRRARSARRGLRARRADVLLPRRRRQRRRAGELGPDRRQLPAHRARRPGRRRRRPQDQRRDAPARPARRRRVVHRVLRPRLRRGVRPDGPRRPRPPRDRGRTTRSRARSGSTTGRRAPGSRSR